MNDPKCVPIESCKESDDFTRCIPEKLRNALKQCIECGKCVGSCTAARVSDFNPRIVVRKVIDKDESVLRDDTIWKCFMCHNCWMICPKKDMDLPELIFRLREISIEWGCAPDKLASLTDWLHKFYDKGKIAGPNSVAEGRAENLRKIAEESGVNVLKKHIEQLKKKTGA